MNLIDAIRGLRSATPGPVLSETLHRAFQENVKNLSISIDDLHAALDEAKFKTDIGIKDAVISVLAKALGNTAYKDFDDIDVYIKSGQMISAIKAYRIRTGMGLADSKAYIDMRRKELCT